MKYDTKLHGFNNYDKPKKVINGPRPSPLMIRKPNSCHKQQRVPIIIYTQSPKIIHTKAQDFMALVQRLTGMSHNDQEVSENFESSLSDGSNSNFKHDEKMWMQQDHVSDGDETTSKTNSVLRRGENCDKGGVNNVDQYNPSNVNFADMPLFTPTSYDFFCSSKPVYQFSDSPFGILGSLISPAGLGFIKELPEY
ncbi:VQ motif-containing protein 8, chloroplastic [Cicer arietinum]|uniref:VQ motif-containing protein 8, chloroplastic n=1 Tax=Cicer arietinum TaxID=3827 RepID=A0A1S2XZQ4_CICAR|nr:VQ motif-containing protein 8, chloroplastic [Cicer arietinum]